jgi:hypothetical protein
VELEKARKIVRVKVWIFISASLVYLPASFVLLSRLGPTSSVKEVVNFLAAAFIPNVLLLNWMFQTLYAGIPEDERSPHQRFVRSFQIFSWALTALLLFVVIFVSLRFNY